MINRFSSHTLSLDDLIAEPVNIKRIEDSRDDVTTPDLDYILGYTAPYIQIRNYVIDIHHIHMFELNEYSKVPKISTIIKVLSTSELGINILQDKELLKIFMRGPDKELSHIRGDYFITSFDKINKGLNTDLIIEAELNIPRLYSSVNKSYVGTSFEVIQQIAKDLNLGFASNIQSTNDKMTWISSNQTYLEFIDYIVKYAWINDNSFLDWYIDPYYNLVFYEVDKTLKYKEVDVKLFLNNISGKKKLDELKDNSFVWKNVLSDVKEIMPTNHGITSMKIINNTGKLKLGYVMENIIVDYDDLEKYQFTNEAISNINEGLPLKSRLKDTHYKEEKKVLYLGIQNDNMHSNYKYAILHNYINNIELQKLNLEVEVSSPNLTYTIGDNIYLQLTDVRIGNNTEEFSWKDYQDGKTTDLKQYTNSYKIQGIKHIYRKSNFFTTYLLTRREWPIEE